METEKKIMQLSRPLMMPGMREGESPVVSTITLWEPTARELILAGAEPNPVKQNVLLISTMIKQPSTMVRHMAPADFHEACFYLNGFGERPVIDDGPVAPYTLSLREPVTTPEGDTLAELVITEPSIDDMIEAAEIAAGSGRLAFDGALLARVTKLDRKVIDNLPARDFLRALALLNFFMAPPPTGPISSPTS